MECSDTSIYDFALRPSSSRLSPRRDGDVILGGGVAVLVTVSAMYALIRDTKRYGYNCPILALHIDKVYTLETSQKSKNVYPLGFMYEARWMKVQRKRPNHGLCYTTVEFPSGVSSTINVSCLDTL